MHIDNKNPDFLAALNSRLVKEIGETYAANCALDLIGDVHVNLLEEARKREAALEERNVALVERTTKDQITIQVLRDENLALLRKTRVTRKKI